MSKVEINSESDVISKHKPLFDRISGKNKSNTFVLSGGRSSYKSYDISLALVVDKLYHYKFKKKANAIVFMQKKEEIRDGAFKQVISVISDLGLTELFKFKTSPFEIEFIPDGSVIKFYGLNGQQGKKANAIDNISWIWFEECDQFDSAESINATLDTVMRHNIQGEEIKVVYAFNPPRSRHHWIFEFIKTLDALCIHTTYLDDDTDKKILSKQQIDRIEKFMETDPSWYSWNYLGIVPTDIETDFPDLIRPDNELELTENDYVFIGIDSATKGKDGTRACVLAYNAVSHKIKLIGFESFDDIWEDGYTSYKVGTDIVNFARSLNANAVYIDPAHGQHIIDAMVKQAPEIYTGRVNFGNKTSDKAKGRAELATNRRAEMYVNASDQLRSKRVEAYCDVSELEKQLNATELEVDAKQIKVIPKDIIKQRIGKSPDEADSFVLAIQAIYDRMKL
ncbi:PBSX family phage terminase large subunit [Lactococcus petauri]|nr:PBSX family phage terminase large subunit [Lactococcus petauri]